MQTELDFTLAKNATKLNPFEIISLQTTGKKNNWKTEEMLARAVVTGDGTDQRVQSLMFMMMMTTQHNSKKIIPRKYVLCGELTSIE